MINILNMREGGEGGGYKAGRSSTNRCASYESAKQLVIMYCAEARVFR